MELLWNDKRFEERDKVRNRRQIELPAFLLYVFQCVIPPSPHFLEMLIDSYVVKELVQRYAG